MRFQLGGAPHDTLSFTACASPRMLRIVSMERHEWLFRVPLNDTRPKLETIYWAHPIEEELANELTSQAIQTAEREAHWRGLT